MPERDKTSDQTSPAKSGSPPRGDDVPQDRDAGGTPDEDSEASTPSRPRGHTEDPDRTL
jgi:hypothetical protein